MLVDVGREFIFDVCCFDLDVGERGEIGLSVLCVGVGGCGGGGGSWWV